MIWTIMVFCEFKYHQPVYSLLHGIFFQENSPNFKHQEISIKGYFNVWVISITKTAPLYWNRCYIFLIGIDLIISLYQMALQSTYGIYCWNQVVIKQAETTIDINNVIYFIFTIVHSVAFTNTDIHTGLYVHILHLLFTHQQIWLQKS